MKRKIRKIFVYTLYVVALAVFFLYLCFPEGPVARYAEHRITQAVPGLRAAIGSVRPWFPPSVVARDIEIRYRNSGPFYSGRMSVSPGYTGMITGKRLFNISAETADGSIHGSLGVTQRASGGQGDVSLKLNLDNIGLEHFKSVFREITNRSVEGELEGSINYTGPADMSGSGSAVFSVREGMLQLNQPFFGIGELEFSNARAEIETENRRVEISDFTLDSRQFSAKASGRIMLSAPLDTSRIRLTAVVTPHPALLESIGGALPGKYRGKEEIPVRITGTLGRPRISIR